MERYQQKLTNFAKRDEPISELPTIVTYVEHSEKAIRQNKDLQFGTDYDIAFQDKSSGGNQIMNLTRGENLVAGLQLNLEVSYDYHWNELTRITPSNFPNYPPHKFGILYTFENQEVGQSVSRVVMGMSTRNNSYCGYGWDFPNDGKVDKATVKLGNEQFVDVKVEKYLYRPEGAKCKRDQPYNDMVIDKISDEMKRRCSRTCRPQNFWICNKAKSNDIPVCKNQTEERCFGQVKDLVKNA